MVSSNLANVGNFNADNGPNVNDWNRDKHNVNLGAARWIVSSTKEIIRVSFAWWILSSHQASYLLPEVLLEVLNSFYWLMTEYLWRVLEEFLAGLVLS